MVDDRKRYESTALSGFSVKSYDYITPCVQNNVEVISISSANGLSFADVQRTAAIGGAMLRFPSVVVRDGSAFLLSPEVHHAMDPHGDAKYCPLSDRKRACEGSRSLLGLDYGELLVFVVSLEAKPEKCGLDASGFG